MDFFVAGVVYDLEIRQGLDNLHSKAGIFECEPNSHLVITLKSIIGRLGESADFANGVR